MDYFDLDRIETAFFNHDSNGADSCNGEWEQRRKEWASFRAYLEDDTKHEYPPEAEPILANSPDQARL